LDELGPRLREAVERVRGDAAPEDLAQRALDATRRRLAQHPHRARRRILFWLTPAAAAAVVLAALTMYFRAGSPESPPVPSQPLQVVHEDVSAAVADELPTAWAYQCAARQSPEALDALLDRHARQLIAADPGHSPEWASLRSIRETL
jgi:hypothetical protein